MGAMARRENNRRRAGELRAHALNFTPILGASLLTHLCADFEKIFCLPKQDAKLHPSS
jgi:hypothetical protein